VAHEPLGRIVTAATAYASAACTTFGAFGYETPFATTTAPLTPIHKGVDLS
jgi:fructoselysine 6-kinase